MYVPSKPVMLSRSIAIMVSSAAFGVGGLTWRSSSVILMLRPNLLLKVMIMPLSSASSKMKISYPSIASSASCALTAPSGPTTPSAFMPSG